MPRDCAVAYADDIILVCCGDVKAIMTQMQFLLDSEYAWAVAHKLRLNVSLCYAMFISSAARTNIADMILSSLLINGDSISWTEQVKILCVTFNSMLSWSTHSKNVRMKISHMSGALQRFGFALDRLTRKRIFQAHILPHVLFCLPVWGNLNISQRYLLDNSLLCYTRLIMRNSKASFNTGTYNFTGILPFQSYILLCNAITVFNILHRNEVDFYLHANLLSNTSLHNTR